VTSGVPNSYPSPPCTNAASAAMALRGNLNPATAFCKYLHMTKGTRTALDLALALQRYNRMKAENACTALCKEWPPNVAADIAQETMTLIEAAHRRFEAAHRRSRSRIRPLRSRAISPIQ
jgi:hypothetical protein